VFDWPQSFYLRVTTHHFLCKSITDFISIKATVISNPLLMKVVNQAGFGFASEAAKAIKSRLSAKHDSASIADSHY
jgi:hypothetical protein